MTSQTVLITGAARRIGREIALDLARSGWRVGVHFRRSREEAESLVSIIAKGGGSAAALEADLTKSDNIEWLIAQCERTLGPPLCLINNASEFQPDSAASLTGKSWDTHLDVNLKAPVFLARAMALALPEGASGNIINIVDQRVWKPTPDFFSYTISKAGLWTATRVLAQALAPRIRVNAIGPGPVLKSIHQTDAEFERERRSILLNRGPSPGDIAAAARFILAQPAMTGQMITLDGGQHLAWRDSQLASSTVPSEKDVKS